MPHNHLRAMDGIKDTAENLQVAIAGENYEVVTMYPNMLAEAQTEGDKRAAQSFNYALQTEKVHEALYREAAETLAKRQGPARDRVLRLPGLRPHPSGQVGEGGRCPICNTPFEKFEKIA